MTSSPVELLLTAFSVLGVAKYAIGRDRSGLLWGFVTAALIVGSFFVIPWSYLRVLAGVIAAVVLLETLTRD